MTIKLETYYEKTVWNEWTNRIEILSQNQILRLFYPNNMDALDLIVNDFIKKRREAIIYSKKFTLLPMNLDERMIMNNHTKKIYEFSKTIYDHMSDYDSTAKFMEEIIAMEYTRFHTLEVSRAIRIEKAEKAEKEEAAESLILLHKRTLQKEARKEARKRKREYDTNNPPPPLRRSSRRTAGINAPISGAKVDTILPDQNY
jgi:hypothetical protein